MNNLYLKNSAIVMQMPMMNPTTSTNAKNGVHHSGNIIARINTITINCPSPLAKNTSNFIKSIVLHLLQYSIRN